MNKGDVTSTLSLSTNHGLSLHTDTDLKLGSTPTRWGQFCFNDLPWHGCLEWTNRFSRWRSYEELELVESYRLHLFCTIAMKYHIKHYKRMEDLCLPLVDWPQALGQQLMLTLICGYGDLSPLHKPCRKHRLGREHWIQLWLFHFLLLSYPSPACRMVLSSFKMDFHALSTISGNTFTDILCVW